MNNYFKILLYISLGFLIFALVKADFLVIPTFHRPWALLVSFLFLFIGIISDAWSWKAILNSSNFKVDYKSAYVSSGMSIFTKYIPGKIWVILGRATFIAEKYNYKNVETSTASLQGQLLSLWCGTLMALISLIGFNIPAIKMWLIALILFFILLSLMLFHKGFLNISSKILSKILSKEITLPNIKGREKLKTIPYFMGIWLFWSLGFYFLICSVYQDTLPFNAGFSFALGGTLGIIAIFAPGGLGIREGAFIAYLSALGLDIQDATTISISSRLWFLTGEILFFSSAFLLRKRI